jgi:uncharacterized protein (DUF2164 family)
MSLSKEERLQFVSSIRRFSSEKLDHDLGEMQAGFLLDYFLSEIAPSAYNQGVEDARRFLLSAAEDLPGSCFQEPLTYWKSQGSTREARRKPGA